MKKKILILGGAGTGKTTLANIIAKETGYKVVEEGWSLDWYSINGEDNTIYTSNCIVSFLARIALSDFTIIELS